MFGLGLQEILLLACFGVVGLGMITVIVLVILRSNRNPPPPRRDDD